MKESFTQAISEEDWTEIGNIPDASLHEKIFSKMKIRKKYSNRKSWLSDALRISIRYKNKLYRKYKKFPSVKNQTV